MCMRIRMLRLWIFHVLPDTRLCAKRSLSKVLKISRYSSKSTSYILRRMDKRENPVRSDYSCSQIRDSYNQLQVAAAKLQTANHSS